MKMSEPESKSGLAKFLEILGAADLPLEKLQLNGYLAGGRLCQQFIDAVHKKV